ncbi:MAG: hypothetical protein WCA56_04110 [Xanthobacteraceae bacterium]
MNSFNPKLVLSALGIVALLTSPAFAKTTQRVNQSNQSASQSIPGYGSDGSTVAIPNPDQR